MRRITTSVAAVALVSAALTAGPADAWFFRVNSNVDTGPKAGRDQTLNSNNKTTTDSYNTTTTNRNDNRTDNRDYSNRSVTNTTDSRNYSTSDSHNSYDSRNLSTNTSDSHNTMNSHNISAGDNSIVMNGNYNPRVGTDKVDMANFSGSNNQINNSAAGYFGIGNIAGSNNTSGK